MSESLRFTDIPRIFAEKPLGLVFILGEPDTGKTTLFKELARAYLKAGLRVGLIDSDVGQSVIGPPTVVGMVMAEGSLPDLSHTQAIYFVGNNSPVGFTVEVVVGSKRMVDKAVEMHADTIIFNSSGLVAPPYGTVLKYNKFELLRPRYVIAIEKEDELSPIFSFLVNCWGIEVVHTRPAEEARKRSPEERAKYRQKKYLEYFKNASLREFEFDKLCLYPTNFLDRKMDTDLTGLLVGLQDERWDTVAIGIIESVDANSVAIFAPYPDKVEIRGLVAGRIRLSRDGVEMRVRP
ncbi:MAG: hypothetical protein K6T91_01765 [Firmicutes bacterium]|nr:hypothetical protein [Bacillota bacterium]